MKCNFSQYIEFQKDGINDDEEKRDKLFKDIVKSMGRDSLVNLSMTVQSGESTESKRENGLIVGHAYTIIRCYEVGWVCLKDAGVFYSKDMLDNDLYRGKSRRDQAHLFRVLKL